MTKVNKISIGDTFTFLTVTAKLKNGFECTCLCGNRRRCEGYDLVRGLIKSCGCLRKTVATYMADSPTYRSWRGMKDRCYKQTHHNYKSYGARGIWVDEKWKNSFLEFYQDMGVRPDGSTLDRIDNNGPYTKDNCRWGTPKEQANNRRNNMVITYLGRTMNAAQWADELGIKRDLIYDRIGRRGWSAEDAFTKPASKRFLRKC